jgi:hypothetical protein
MASNKQRGGGGTRRGRRGFASMDPQKQRQIAKKGGEASARLQRRDEQGQFAGTSGPQSSASNSSSSSRDASGHQAGGQRGTSGGSNR